MSTLQMLWESAWPVLQHMSEEGSRWVGTACVVLGGVLAHRLTGRFLDKQEGALNADALRQRKVYLRNIIIVVAIFCVLTIWASKIAGFAFSLAALTGAILLTSKEVLMSVLGHLVLTATRPYRMGDWIEVGTVKGKVVDMDVLATTVVESVAVHQATGGTVSFPNSLVLTTPVRNLSITAPYLVVLYRIVLPFSGLDLEKAEEAALAAAEEVTGAWREEADRVLHQFERRQYIDLPSSKPKVMWEAPDGKTLHLILRFSCPCDARGHTEQAVFKAFWKRFHAAGLTTGASAAAAAPGGAAE